MSENPEKNAEDDDAVWFAALTGRSPAAAESSPAADAGRALRAALLSLDREEAANEPLDADWERLRFRLRRENLCRPRRRLPFAGWALAASLCLAVGLAWQYARAPLDLPESVVLRGAPATTLVLRVADPAAAAERLIEAGRAAGIAVRRRDGAEATLMLDMDLPAPLPAALAEVFKDYASEPPAPGKVTLVLMGSR